MRSTFILLLLLFGIASRAAELPAIHAESITTPVAANATGASLAVSPEGIAWLSWLERSDRITALRFSVFDAGQKRWSAAQTSASGLDWFVNTADFPALTLAADGRATAVWFVNNPPSPSESSKISHDHHGPSYGAFISQTADRGKTWSTAVPLTRESDSVEFVSLATLADGRVLAAWLDGRDRKRGGKAQQLFARIIGDNSADVLVDPSVCDCCQTALTAFPDGTALLAYRGRTSEEIRDIRVTRFRRGSWETPRTLHSDNWKIAGCPVNGPQLASDGGRVAAAWFTAADDNPRVLATLSLDAGDRFLLPVQISETKPAGRVATLLLHDGALLVTWVDADGGLWLRRVTPDFAPTEPLQLAAPANGRVRGFPRVALLRDYVGGKAPAQLLVAFTREADPALRTLLITVPEAELLEAEKNCECAPSADQLRGFSIRGTVVAAQPARGTARVQHVAIPGIFEAGERDFKLASDVTLDATNATTAGRHFFGRIERREGAWWLFGVRWIATAPR